ncbi:hypothetical protein LguiB_004394 [Lonicera macranthoides]
MWNEPRATTGGLDQDQEDEHIRDIHALTPPPPQPPPPLHPRRGETWETSSQRSLSQSMASIEGASSENFSSISREFNALVLAGSTVANNGSEHEGTNLGRIGEEDMLEETNPLAIVPDNNPMDPMPSPRRGGSRGSGSSLISGNHSDVSVQRVKREEVESKISAWQNAKIAKINNRFKREDAIIHGWEGEQVQQSTSKMKRVELEEKRARALEKMQNDIARAHRKAEERRASAEAKRGTKVARVFEISNLMRAVGRAPSKRSFF